ncbi:MAG TPA: tetratricopeptide repeat protein [Sphingobacteriaceae bacterium]
MSMRKAAFVLTVATAMTLHAAAQGRKAVKEPAAGALTGVDSLLVKQWFFAGLREKTVQNYQLAADMFKRVVDLDAGNDAARYELAVIYANTNQDSKAVGYILEAARLKPDNAWYLMLLADIYKRQNNMTGLIPVLNELIRINPDNPHAYFDKASALLLQDQAGEAARVYEEIEERFGYSEELAEARQRSFVQTGKPEKAVAELEKQIRENPQEIRNYLYLGELYAEGGQRSRALAVLKKARDLEPANGLVRLALADHYRSENQGQSAFIELKEAFADQHLAIDQKVRIVLSFFPSFQDVTARAEAEELASILTRVHPDDPKAHAVYGDVLFQQQKLAEARTAYKQALALNEQVYLIWEQLLRIQVSMGDYSDAIRDGEAALTIFPNQAPLYLYAGIAYSSAGQHDKAVSNLRNAAALETEDEEALGQIYSALGNSYNALKKYRESNEAFEKALEYTPKNAYTLNNYAYYLALREENLARAEAMARLANEIEPGNPSFEDTFAWILFKMKKYQEAKTWMEKAISDEGNNGTQFEHYGDILFHLGEVDRAVMQWKKALEKGAKSDSLEKKVHEKKYFK